jgi:Ca2+-binding EF-hand superfamily protein
MLDVNKDGRVSPDELKNMLKQFGIKVCDDIIQLLVKDASKNGNNCDFSGILV